MRVFTNAAVIFMAVALSACSKTATCLATGAIGCAIAASADNKTTEKRSGRVLPVNTSGRVRLGGLPQADTPALRQAAENAEQKYKRNGVRTAEFYDSDLREMLLNKTLLVAFPVRTEANATEAALASRQQIMYLAPNGEMKSWAPDSGSLNVGDWGIYKNYIFCSSVLPDQNEEVSESETASCAPIGAFESQIKSSKSGDVLELMQPDRAPLVWDSNEEVHSLDDLVQE